MITLADYWMGRDVSNGLALTPQIERNALRLLGLANALVTRARAGGVPFRANPRTGSLVASGWRPPSVNASTPGAAPNSKHMTGEAIDVYDPDGDIDDWLMGDEGQALLAELGIWIEHPSATKSWSHWQMVPPRSGRRVFYP